jgi:hypothetical protein
MTSWTSIELMVGEDGGGASAPTLVFAADDRLFAPDALRDRVAAGIGVAAFEAKPAAGSIWSAWMVSGSSLSRSARKTATIAGGVRVAMSLRRCVACN